MLFFAVAPMISLLVSCSAPQEKDAFIQKWTPWLEKVAADATAVNRILEADYPEHSIVTTQYGILEGETNEPEEICIGPLYEDMLFTVLVPAAEEALSVPGGTGLEDEIARLRQMVNQTWTHYCTLSCIRDPQEQLAKLEAAGYWVNSASRRHISTMMWSHKISYFRAYLHQMTEASYLMFKNAHQRRQFEDATAVYYHYANALGAKLAAEKNMDGAALEEVSRQLSELTQLAEALCAQIPRLTSPFWKSEAFEALLLAAQPRY